MMFFWIFLIGIFLYLLLNGNVKWNQIGKKTPIERLDERLANGDITIEEYLELKSTMKER